MGVLALSSGVTAGAYLSDLKTLGKTLANRVGYTLMKKRMFPIYLLLGLIFIQNEINIRNIFSWSGPAFAIGYIFFNYIV
jgi:hypothetical protein